MPLVFLYLLGLGIRLEGESRGKVRWSGYVVAPIWRDNVQGVGRAAWGRSCGSAKLLAGTLRCLRLCCWLPWDWSDEEQLGRCPKPHKGRCPLTPPKGLRPSGLPFARLSWLLLHALPACLSFWCCDLILFHFPLPHDSIIPPRCQQIHQCINHRKHHIASNPDSIKQRVIMQSKCP